ncbi:tenascin-X isoform X18 [Erinaceus europaeus]|uniref:Tenascin-X isoform X18 n=1 Tax=Erinaceus europaeus TaxID=9365 RepID=A0ABM3X9K6_ERIEU|nr:tenascin-X isoform X18 [Erinaceus europaeus]
MMPTPCSLTSSLALLVLLGTVRAGPFSPRFNITRPGPRPPPQPGGHTAEPGVGSPSAQLYEHTVEGGEKQVVFTHRINLPPSAGCGCPPGTEPPAPASEVQSLKVRLEILEELVQGLKEQCTGGCCPVTAKAGTGQTDTRSLCSLHGVFDLSRCACSCEPGWGGPTCSDPTDAPVSPSSSPSCPDDCNDQGRCVRGRCECFPGYTGPSCSWPSCPGDCHGRGRCVQGVCVCRPGFSGADCSLRACPRGCSQKGRCEDGRCVCNPGYTGDDCGVKSCPRDCSQRGRCENGRCVCNPGYTGDDCGARSCPRGCSQKGRCEDGRCVCEPGYTGADCGSRSCPWDCGEGGRCVDGRCVCWPGYAGDDCSRRTCPRDCHGRGRCEDGECLCDAGYSGDDCGVRSCPGDCSQRGRCEDGRCVCWPGYTGPDCGAKSCPRDCRGRGRCEAGVCVCHPGYGGDDCGVRSCPGDCRGRGRCESGRCVCWPGYTGRDCGVRACPGDCRGRGRCVDGRCICNPGFAGDDCGSRRCPGDCRGRGRCEDGVCVCDAGYQGEDCGARSCPGGCRGRGQCLDGRCVCDDGYEGEDCGVRRCPRDCSQRGVCQDGVCACWEGYAGEDCGLRTCPSNCHGRGRCEEGRCVCDSGYTGPTCGVRTCPSDCRGHGRCVQGVCVCHPGYSGPDCGQDEPPASACPGGCGPRELCREGRCVCVEGFRGPDCAIQTCPADCLGRGECLEGSCVCQEGYAGEDCSEEIPAIENMRMHLLEETTVRTEWTRGPGTVDAYEIQFIPMFSLLQTEGMSPPFTARVPSSASAYDQRGLAPGQEYQVTVRALRGTSWGPPASKTITTMIDGPQDLRVVAVTPTTLDLSWLRPQAEVDRFVVSYVSAGNQRVRLEVPPEADRALLTDLMPGVEYVVTVTAERGPAVSYPASIRANTAPGHYSYPEVRPPPPSPQPRPGPQPSPPLLPPRPRRPSRPAEEVGPESRLPPSPPQPPRRPWGNLTAELGRFRGSVQDLERHLRARGYPLRANQTYTAVARHIHEYLLRRQAAPPAPPPRRPHPTASPNAGARKRDSSQGSYDRGTVPRHPKPEVLGFSADGTLLVSLDGLRGHFERMVLRWRPELPADGPGGELTVPGTSRTASLPNLKPSTTYHVEVHGVRAGQTSKSYAFVTTTGSSPTGFLGATDEPPPSGPSTTQGAQAPTLQHRPQELGELRVLGRDMTGRLHVTWTAQPDTFAHFQLTLQVPEGSWVHEELLPGDVHEALVPSPPPGVAYELTLHGVLPSGEPSSPLTYHGIKEKPEKPEKPLTLPRLGELTVTDAASSSLTLHWTVSEGEFDSFVIQYKDRDGPQVVPVEGSQREALITNLELNRKYKFVLYGMVGKKKHGPLVAEAKIVPQSDPISETSPRLGKLWVTDPTPDSLHLSWTVPEGQFDSFLVQYRGKDGQPQVIPVEGPERSATVSQLAPDHKYRFTLFGIANRKRHGPLMAEGTTAPEKKPGHPEPLEQPLLGKLTVNGATPDSLVLSWTVDQGSFDSFMVQYKDAQGQPQAVPVRGHENTVTIRGLESNRKYKMNLYGLHGRHRVGPVSVVASTAPQEVMETPTEPPSTEAPEPPEEPLLGKLTVTGSSQDSLSLSWTVPQGHFDRFLVQYKNGDGQPKVVRVPGTQDWVTISGLEPDHKYKVNLYGFHNGQRVGPISATGVTATEEKTPTETEVTPTEPPSTEAPESPEEPLLGELTVTGSSQDSLSLSWTVPQGHFDRFLVQYKNGDGQPKVVRVPGTQDWVTISGLEPDHKYKVNLYGFHNGQRVGPISATGVTATEEKTPTETEVTPTEPPSTEAPESPEEPLLGELTVTGSSQDSLSLSWTVPQGHFDRFLVQYKNGDGQPKVVRVPGTQDWVTISGLEPDHKYKMNLYGFHNGQRVGPISAFGVTDAVEETPIPTEPPSTEAPEPPEEPLLGELTVSGSSQDSLSLSWTVPQGHFDSFTIQYKDKDGQPQVVRVRGEEREVTVRGLDAGRKYKMHLYGLHGGQRVGPVSTVGVTEPEGEPTSPPVKPLLGELTVTGSSQDSLSLSWTVPQGQFDHFLVQYKNGDGQPKVLRVPGTQDWVTISGLEPDHKYKMNLYGFHGDQREGPISTVGVTGKDEEMTPFPTDGPTTTPEPPFKPHLGELTVTGSSQDSLSLSWTVPQGHFDRFLVQYKNGDGQPKVVRVPGTQDWVTISGLEPDHKYKVNLYGFHNGQRVGPISAIGVTDAVEETPTLTEPLSTEAPEPSEEPLLGELTVTGSSQDSLSLSWTVPQGQFDRFLVQYKNGDGQPKVVRVPGTQDWVTISGLEPDHKYKVNLYGFHNGQRVGPISATGVTATEEKTPTETEVTPTEPPSTEAPESPEEPLLGELTVTGSSQDSLSLSWTVPQGHFDRFLVQYKNGDGQPKVVRVPGTQDWVTISGLEPDHKYKVNLYGFHNGQRVGPISAFGVTDAVEETPTPTEPPSTEAPDPPVEPLLGELTVTGSSQDSLSLSWTVPQGHFDSFTIQYKDRDGQPQVVRVGGEEREVTVRGLDAGRKYKMHLYGLHGGQRVGPVSTVGVTDAVEETPTPTEPPSTEAPEPTVEPLLGELTVTESSQDSLSLSWTVPQGHFDSFTIQYKDRDGQPQVVRVGGEEREVTVQGLDAGRKYKMHLYGLHGGQRVGPVSTVGVTVAHDIVEKTPTPTEPPSTEAPESPEEPLLGELTVTGSSQDSLSLSWTVPQGQFDRFLVQYKNGDGHPKVVRVPGTQDWVTISGLEPDHKYKVNLYGFHNGQHVGPISAFGVTDAVEETPTPTEPPSTETPEPPEESLLGELTVTGSSQDSLSLSWTVPQGHFDSFTIQYKDRDGQPQVVRVGGEEREVTVQGLDAGRKYKMHLYGLHGGQRVGPVSTVGVTDSETVTTQVSPTTTSEPPFKTLLGELTITDTTPDSLSLSWTITEGQFDRFLVQYKNGDGQPKVVRVPGTQDWVTITGLEPDHKYKVNLYGFHNGQRVGPISVFGVTDAVEETPIPTEPPSTEAPEPPEESLLGELTVTGSSQDSLSLSWTVPQGHFDSFTIQYKDKDGQPQVVRVGGEEREVTVRGLDAGHKYKMHLYGLHGGQRVGPVSTVGLTASLPTEPPVALSLGELTVVSVASDTVHLSWTVAQGPFDSFLVQYKDSQGQPQAVPVDGSLREVIVSGLDPARKYKFLLFGLQDEKKHGPVSTEAKTLPDKKPSPRLGDLTVTDVTPDSVGLLWTVPEGEFDSFVVQYKDKDRQPQVVPVAADQRKVTIPGLEPKKKYKFLLYGLAGRKRLGPVSAEGTTAPLEKELPPLPRLGELTLTDETPDSIHLSWTVAQGPFDSFVVQYRGTDGQPRAVPVAADEREVTIEGLEAGKKYKFLLFGLFRGQRLGPISGLGATASAEDTPIPGIPATEAPEGPRLGVLTVNSVAPDALRLSWSVAQGVFESFVIQYRDTDGKSQALLVDGDQSTVLVSSLEPSTPYMFSLYGLHGGKRLGPISAEGITGPAPPAGEIPGEPRPRLSQLSVTDVTTSSLRLNWEAPPGAFDSFLLRFGVPSQSSLEPYPRPLLQRELTVPGSRRSAAIRDLRPGTLYNLTLYGLRGPHKADSIQGSARTLSPVLESPHDLQFSEIGETSAKVSWTPPPSRVDSFKVSYQLADGGEPQSVRVDSRAQTQTLKGLAPGTRYEVTVVSIRGFEESEPLTGFFTTVSDGPTKLQALNLTEGSTVLHWDPPQNPVDTYDVQVTAPEAPSLQASAPGSAVDYPLSGLELHTNYTAMVRGLRGSNFTSPANITFTTGLEAPRDLEAKEVTPRTALLTWTEPPDPPTGYLLSFNTPGEQTQEILLPGGVTSHRLLGLFPSTTYNAFLRAVWGESFSPPMPTSFTTGGLRIPFPRDCGEEMQNGISTSRTTTIFLNGNRERPLDVFCDMETDGGGWLVFQRRMDGKTDFWRDWEDYAHGFGNISREFWLGNEALHSLTSSGDYSLRVDLRAGDEAVFAHYDSFRVDSAAKYYQLHLEGYHGTAGDSMTYHSGSVFSARDRDPNNLLISCAVSYRGAWWYRNCHYANLNGLYGSTVDHQGVSWYYWKGFGFSVPFTEMKLRPRNYHPPAWGG